MDIFCHFNFCNNRRKAKKIGFVFLYTKWTLKSFFLLNTHSGEIAWAWAWQVLEFCQKMHFRRKFCKITTWIWKISSANISQWLFWGIFVHKLLNTNLNFRYQWVRNLKKYSHQVVNFWSWYNKSALKFLEFLLFGT